MIPRILHFFLLLSTLVLLISAWSTEDHEIFRLRDEVETSEGPDVTFYDVLGIKSSATVEEISRALKKKSVALHPDKVKHSFVAARSTGKPKKKGENKKPGVHVSKGPSQREIQKFVKQATERYSRLTVVANLLKGRQRDRYDHFLQYGFPKWRGTGYYYSRYRPGFGTVLVGLFLVMGGAAHYFALMTSYKRQRDFVERYIKHARRSAWGDESGIRGIPGLNGPVEVLPTAAEEPDSTANLNRRQKRELDRQNKKDTKSGKLRPGKSSNDPAPSKLNSSTPTGEKRRVTAENGKTLIVDSIGNVYLEEEDEEGNVEEFLLDPDEIQKPTIRDTALVRLPIWLYRKAFDPFLKSTKPIPSVEVPSVDITEKIHESEPIISPDKMSSSQEQDSGFEIVDSSGIENEMVAAGIKKRGGKKQKK